MNKKVIGIILIVLGIASAGWGAAQQIQINDAMHTAEHQSNQLAKYTAEENLEEMDRFSDLYIDSVQRVEKYSMMQYGFLALGLVLIVAGVVTVRKKSKE